MTKARDIANLGDSLINDADDNVALGDGALDSQTTGANNVAIGESALASNTSASDNTAVGYQAGFSKTTGDPITAVGYQALTSVTTGAYSTAVGRNAGDSVTTGNHNTLMGNFTGADITTGANNTAIGSESLRANTTASNNTAVGYQAGYNGTTSAANTLIGKQAGYYLTTANGNTFIGCNSGEDITTGQNNTVIGRYQGNQGGLDIRTSSNNIVLSDGDGNPRAHIDSNGILRVPSNAADQNASSGTGFTVSPSGYVMSTRSTVSANLYINKAGTTGEMIRFLTSGTDVGSIDITGSSTSYNTSSDYRLKENVVELTGATDRLKQLEPKRFNFIADADTTVDGFIAHEVQAVVPEAITGTKDAVDADGNPEYQGIDQSKLVPLLVATIKELEARITGLETENTAIKARLDALESV